MPKAFNIQIFWTVSEQINNPIFKVVEFDDFKIKRAYQIFSSKLKPLLHPSPLPMIRQTFGWWVEMNVGG